MKKNHFRGFLSRNILLTHEVAEKLNMSKQRVSLLNKSGELTPIKSTKNGSVYLLQDVIEYMERQNMLPKYFNPLPPKYLGPDASVFSNVNYARETLKKLSDIVLVAIYFEEIDAAIENFFILQGNNRYGDLISLTIPSMVVRDANGDEMWIFGCNCGYSGTGPSESEKILKEIGIEQSLIDEIYENAIIKYIKDENNKWETVKKESDFDYRSVSHNNELYNIHAHIFWHQGRLTLIQDKMWSRESKPDLVLEKYWSFIPNPVEYILFKNDEQAVDNGYFDPSVRENGIHNGVYKMIIRDLSGRQLWLDPIILDNIPLKKQPQLKDILLSCGFEKEADPINKKLKNWTEILIKRTEPGDPITGSRDPFR